MSRLLPATLRGQLEELRSENLRKHDALRVCINALGPANCAALEVMAAAHLACVEWLIAVLDGKEWP